MVKTVFWKTKGIEYIEQNIEKYEQKIRETQTPRFMRKAYELNMMIVLVEK
jgi:hypothetical protein